MYAKTLQVWTLAVSHTCFYVAKPLDMACATTKLEVVRECQLNQSKTLTTYI